MAAAGTVTAQFNNNGAWAVTIAGVTQGATSQQFTLKDYLYTSYSINGTYGAGASLQWQGSNDGGVTFDNIGQPILSTDPQSGTLTPNQMFFELYQLAITGGDGTTNIGVTIRAYITR